MSLQVFDDAKAVAACGAERFCELAQKVSGPFRVALAGGSSPKAMYELLAEPLRGRVDWSRVEIFFGDERCVPEDHADSNYGMAKATLLDHVRPSAVHRMRGEAGYEKGAAEYAPLVEGIVFDLILLGMGPDGHTASLFPGKPALEESVRRVVGVPEPGLAPHVPRISLTFPAINQSRVVLIACAGAEKAEALRTALYGEPHAVPVSRVRPIGTLEWVVDRAAASLISRRGDPH
jgi:6-phosphogluconolactonase